MEVGSVPDGNHGSAGDWRNKLPATPETHVNCAWTSERSSNHQCVGTSLVVATIAVNEVE